jgi:hypothetical protein
MMAASLLEFAAMTVAYDRRNPSARYRRLVELYREMHQRGETIRGIAPEHTFPGASLLPQAHRVRRLVALTGARSILDYGSGKGAQYRPMALAGGDARWESVQEYWGVERIACYDPGYEPFSRAPAGPFDGVVCTDVLEHCPEEDLEWIVAELFSLASKFVFASVACHPAVKRLPNGENAHCTVRPPEFWQALFAARNPAVIWEVRAYTRGAQRDVRLGNAAGAELEPVALA